MPSRRSPTWLVDARFEPSDDPLRSYHGRFHAGAKPRLPTEAQALEIVAAVRDGVGEITKVEKREVTDKPPMLYDLTSLQRDANTRFGFSARRTLGAAQRLYEEHKALTYPRTNSRYLTSDMAEEIKPTAELVGARAEYRDAANYVSGLDVLPLARVIDDAKVTDHHAIIPTRAEHPVEKMGDDDRRVYDLVVRRFLAAFHPDALLENTRVETTVAEHVFRTRGKVLLVPGWRGVYLAAAEDARPQDAPPTTMRAETTSCHGSSRVSPRARSRSKRSPRRPSRRVATPTPRCSARWRPRASSSTTRRCARR